MLQHFGESLKTATCDWQRIRKQPVGHASGSDFLDKYSKTISVFFYPRNKLYTKVFSLEFSETYKVAFRFIHMEGGRLYKDKNPG